MMSRFLKCYNFCVGIIWGILFFTLWMQFLPRAFWVESALFTFCLTVCAFAVSTFISRRIMPKAFADKKARWFVTQFVAGVLFLAFLLAAVVELFYMLEHSCMFPVSILISDIYDPFLLRVLGMLPTAIMVVAGLCGLELFRNHAAGENERIREQLHFLKNQMNSHLTFNVLNHVHILMHKDVERADELLLRFADVLRYQLYECNNDIVLLESELKYVMDVVEIEKMRWGDELDVNTNWKVEYSMATIRPLMLIPFIENAFKHVARLPDRKGCVYIHFSQEAKFVRLVVENSKSPVSPRRDEHHSGLGLMNTRKRLDISYPERYSLDIQETDCMYRTDLQIILE